MRVLQEEENHTNSVAHMELNSHVLTLKATSSGLLEILDQFIEGAVHREEVLRSYFDP